MIYLKIFVLAMIVLLAIFVWNSTVSKFIQNMKIANEYKKRTEIAKQFNEYYYLATGKKINIAVSLNTNTCEFEYNKEAE